jgi:hypothetical protein
MQRHDKRKKRIRFLIDVPPEQLWRDHGVTEAANWEELSHTLEERKYNRLGMRDFDRGGGLGRGVSRKAME